ncbi:MAK10-like protein [Tanacetum coccineum]
MHMRLFQFSLRDQASNWLERLPAGPITTWEDLTTRFLAQFFPPGRTAKLYNDILMFQQHHGESLSEAWARFKDLLQKVPHHGIDLWLQVQIFYDHVNPVTRRTIDQSAGGKLRDLNAEESWALLEDLALYDNESWNDPRDFAKLVKAIALPQDVPSTYDRRLIELENQVQCLMEAYLTSTQPAQVNKITTSCEICSGPHDTQYYMEVPEKAFVEYASSRTDEARGLVSNFMASQDARLSKFEANFKQQQSEMTNKIDTVLKAITDRIAGTLPSDTVKNLKLGTHPVLSAHSYLTIDPQCSSNPSNSISAIKAHFNKATISQTSLWQPEIETKLPQPEDPKPTLKDEFQDLHLNLPVLKVLAHALIYNAILDKCVESLELGKNRSVFVQGEILVKNKRPRTIHSTLLADGTKSYPVRIVNDVEVHIGKLKLLNDFYVIDMKKYPETPLLVGRGFLATANAVIDCRMAKIAVGEGITRSVYGVKGVDISAKPPYYARKDFLDCHLPGEWEISRDAELNPFKDTLVFRRIVEFLGAIPINLKCNMWESEDVLENQLLSVSLLICLGKRDCEERIPSGNMEMEPDIKNMTISEYLEYEAAKERRL